MHTGVVLSDTLLLFPTLRKNNSILIQLNESFSKFVCAYPPLVLPPEWPDGCEEEAVQLYMPWWGCRCLVPDLLLHELELSMEKLGLICDKVYAWDVFSDMMVRRSDNHGRTLPQHTF